MKHYILSLLFLCLAVAVQAQFRMVSNNTPSWTSQNDSTYTASISFSADQTGFGYLANQIDTTYRLFTGTEQLYRVDSVWNTSFSSADLRVVEISPTNGSPAGQVMAFDPDGRKTIPAVPFGSTGSTAQLQAAVVSWNARNVASQEICKVGQDPNLIPDLETIDPATECVIARDTVNNLTYEYDASLPVGSRWVENAFAPSNLAQEGAVTGDVIGWDGSQYSPTAISAIREMTANINRTVCDDGTCNFVSIEEAFQDASKYRVAGDFKYTITVNRNTANEKYELGTRFDLKGDLRHVILTTAGDTIVSTASTSGSVGAINVENATGLTFENFKSELSNIGSTQTFLSIRESNGIVLDELELIGFDYSYGLGNGGSGALTIINSHSVYIRDFASHDTSTPIALSNSSASAYRLDLNPHPSGRGLELLNGSNFIFENYGSFSLDQDVNVGSGSSISSGQYVIWSASDQFNFSNGGFGFVEGSSVFNSNINPNEFTAAGFLLTPANTSGGFQPFVLPVNTSSPPSPVQGGMMYSSFGAPIQFSDGNKWINLTSFLAYPGPQSGFIDEGAAYFDTSDDEVKISKDGLTWEFLDQSLATRLPKGPVTIDADNNAWTIDTAGIIRFQDLDGSLVDYRLVLSPNTSIPLILERYEAGDTMGIQMQAGEFQFRDASGTYTLPDLVNSIGTRQFLAVPNTGALTASTNYDEYGFAIPAELDGKVIEKVEFTLYSQVTTSATDLGIRMLRPGGSTQVPTPTSSIPIGSSFAETTLTSTNIVQQGDIVYVTTGASVGDNTTGILVTLTFK